ncbi:hypothetical protein ACS0TY_001781 [Phlomoides rotata]
MYRSLVDETPVRVHSNVEHKGILFPKDQAMSVYSSIWNADDWATQGGRVEFELLFGLWNFKYLLSLQLMLYCDLTIFLILVFSTCIRT